MEKDRSLQDVRLAVLIDADNISSHYVKGMLEEIARYGTPTIKRIYGDWTKPNLGGWKTVLLDYAISPIQQFNYTTGKNATDSAMTIDAMDILYAEKVDAFCLVSSDSDFTKLATRLREAGKIVYGIGEQKTPTPFIAACDRFIFLEILDEDDDDTEDSLQDTNKSKSKRDTKSDSNRPHRQKKRAIQTIDKKTIRLISQTIKDVEDDNGWAYLGEVGNLIVKKQPSFDARNYGFNKLTSLFDAIDDFEIDIRDAGTGPSNSKHVYVRVKDNKKKKTTHF